MSYAFHDIKNIVEPYLDDIPTHSQQWEDHPWHIRDILLRCCHYNICLNPNKCVFCIETGFLLGFVVSKDGIYIDPLKIAAIPALPTPTNLLELQSLQGKAKFTVSFAILQRKHTVICVSLRRTLCSFGMTKPNGPLIISNMLWLIHPWSPPRLFRGLSLVSCYFHNYHIYCFGAGKYQWSGACDLLC